MEGLGLRFRTLMEASSRGGLARAYVSLGMAAAGSFLAASICLPALVLLTHRQVLQQDTIKFLVTVTYVYCFSLVLTGPLQLVLYRYLSDALYQQRPEVLPAALRGALGLHAAVAVPAGLLFFWACGFEPTEMVAGAIFYGLTVCIFVTALFLLVCLAYSYVAASFIGALALSTAAAWWLGLSYGYPGLLMGFLGGHTLLFVLLYGRLVRELPASSHATLGWVAWAWRNPWLLLTGAAINLAPWTDKMAFWWGPGGYQLQGLLQAHEVYDTCLLLAMVTAVPAYAHFLLVFETRFHRLYRDFCVQVSRIASHARIASTRDQMAATLRYDFTQRAKLHGAILLAVFYLAPAILAAVRLPVAYAHVLRVGALGAAVCVEVLIHVVLLVYCDRQKEAAVVALFFAMTNALFGSATAVLDLRFHGYGFFGSGLLSLIFALWLVSRRLSNLDYLVFRSWAVRSRSARSEEWVA